MVGVVAGTKNLQGVTVQSRKIVIAGLNKSGKMLTRDHRQSVYGKLRVFDSERPLYRHTAPHGEEGAYLEVMQGKIGRNELVFVFIALKDEFGQWVVESLWLPHEMKEFIKKNPN